MDSQQAKDRLELIKEAQSAAVVVGSGGLGWLLVIWGVVWLTGFSLSHAVPDSRLLWIWLLLLTAGSAGSAIVGVRLSRKMHYAETGPRQAAFYLLLLAFGVLWIVLAEPSTWEQIAVLIISFVGFGTASSGILIRVRYLVMVGVLVTVITVLAYLLLLPYFGLIVGIVGGGGMIAVGCRLLLRKAGHG